jgi:hypothetical protein
MDMNYNSGSNPFVSYNNNLGISDRLNTKGSNGNDTRRSSGHSDNMITYSPQTLARQSIRSAKHSSPTSSLFDEAEKMISQSRHLRSTIQNGGPEMSSSFNRPNEVPPIYLRREDIASPNLTRDQLTLSQLGPYKTSSYPHSLSPLRSESNVYSGNGRYITPDRQVSPSTSKEEQSNLELIKKNSMLFAENEKLVKEAGECRFKVNTYERTNQMLESKVRELEASIDTIELYRSQFDKEKINLVKKIDDLTFIINWHQQENKTLLGTVQIKEQEINELKRSRNREEADKQIEKLTMEREKLLFEKSEITRKFENESIEAKHKYELDINELTRKLESERAEFIYKLDAERKDLIGKYSAQIENLISQYASEKSNLIAQYNFEKQNLVSQGSSDKDRQLYEKQNLLNQYKAENDELKGQLQNEVSSILSQHKAEMENLIAQHVYEKQNLITQHFNEKENLIIQYGNEKENLVSQHLYEKENLINQHVNEKENLQNMHSSLTMQLDSKHKDSEHTKNAITTHYESRMSINLAEIDRLKYQLSTVTAALEAEREASKGHVENILFLSDQNKDHHDNVEYYKKDNTVLIDEMNAIKKELGQAKEKVVQLEFEKRRLAESNGIMSSTDEALKKTLDNLTHDFEQFKGLNANNEAKIASLQKELNEAQAIAKKLQNLETRAKLADQLESDMVVKDKELEVNRKTVQEWKKRYGYSVEEHARLNNVLVEREGTIENQAVRLKLIGQLQHDVNDLGHRFRVAQQDLERMRIQVQLKEKEIENMKNKKDDDKPEVFTSSNFYKDTTIEDKDYIDEPKIIDWHIDKLGELGKQCGSVILLVFSIFLIYLLDVELLTHRR